MDIDNADNNVSSKTNLIVNYLPPDITLGGFVKLFQSVGEIDTFRLVKDKDTGVNLGYGFINYCRKEDAEVAVKTLNGAQISNKTIRVAYARPDAPKSVNVFVSGLPPTMHLHELENLFSGYGRVITTRLLLDDNKTVDSASQKVNAIGFVRFEERSDAERAISELNGTMLPESIEPLTVMFPTENAKRLNASFAEFIKGGVNSRMTTVRESKLKSGGKEGVHINKGMNRFSPMGNIAPPPILANTANINQGHVVYIFGLHEDSGDSILWELFGPFGPVQSAKVVKDPSTDKCKGFGFVTMVNYGDALEAIRALNGYQHRNRRLQVSFKTSKKN
ncbi:hypothetical protein O3M35_008192 [Rhynocoris fuscipes]|uniref:RRM domain-containing protein n=1 Tax=Rhynocoris fuscipes TaxID=488301 RepID=A0AAW1D5H6_9HEMI